MTRWQDNLIGIDWNAASELYRIAPLGEKSAEVSPIWSERQRLLLTWLPNVEGFVLPGTTHLLHAQNPRGMAEALASFFARHPIAD